MADSGGGTKLRNGPVSSGAVVLQPMTGNHRSWQLISGRSSVASQLTADSPVWGVRCRGGVLGAR